MTGPTETTRTIDLNSDLGEGFGSWSTGDDSAVLDIVSSANLACGFHAGDPTIMADRCRRAAARGVRVGAHIAYRDLAGFGRRAMAYAPEDLTVEAVYQIGALHLTAVVAGTRVRYVKPHGALYNTIARDETQARAVVAALTQVNAARGRHAPLALMVQPGTVVEHVARGEGVPVIREAFADRGYTPDGTLVSRREPGAMIDDPAEAARRMVRLVTEGVVTAVDGTDIALDVDSVCVHGDSPHAVEMSRTVREALVAAGVTVTAPGEATAPATGPAPGDAPAPAGS